MRIQPLVAIFLRQLYLIRSSPLRVVTMFFGITIDSIVWGFMTRYLSLLSPGGPNFSVVLLGAVLFWNFCVHVMWGITVGFLEDVNTKNLQNLFATPLTVTEYLAGLLLTTVLSSLIGLTFMLLIAAPMFGLPISSIVSLLPPLFVLLCFGASLGIIGNALILRFGPSVHPICFALPALVSPFVGVFYPLTVLPEWMRATGKLLPPSYVFEYMRTSYGAHMNLAGLLPLKGALPLAVFYLLGSSLMFATFCRHAVSDGTLARHSSLAG